MPELPEVEVIRRDLVPKVVGRAIASAKLTAPRLTRRRGSPAAVEGSLVGRTVVALRRRGKFLLFDLTGDRTLVLRLGMTGQLRWAEDGRGFSPDAHTHAQIVFGHHSVSDPASPVAGRHIPQASGLALAAASPVGRGVLFYRDIRKFGEMFLLPSGAVDHTLGIGLEPLDPALRAEEFFRLCRATTRIKPLLLDQTKLAGIGNIYADEALFRAGIRPTRRARTLTRLEAARLLRALRAVLRAGIRHRGSSISDYRDASGSPGGFVRLHRVYQRHGKPCRTCGTPIRRIQLSQRGTHFCPTCQR